LSACLSVCPPEYLWNHTAIFTNFTVHVAYGLARFSSGRVTKSQGEVAVLGVFFSERELTFTFAICYRPSVCLSSVCLSVCNVRAPYSGGSNFWQYFYGIRYLGHPLTSTENFTEIVPGNASAGKLNTRGVAKYCDFGPIDGYISETVQDRRYVSINH